MEEVKLVAVGDLGVGKTSYLIAFTTNAFPEDYIPTVFDNYTSNLLVGNTPVSLTLWDTAGQEDYDRLRPLSYPLTNVFALMFALDSEESLNSISSKWIPEIENHCPGTPSIMIGLKADVANDAVLAKAKAKAKEHNIVLVTASSKEGTNVADSMQKAAQVALTKGAPMKTEMKVLVVGDTGVGKSTLVDFFVRDNAARSSPSEKVYNKTITVDGTEVKLEIVDVVGSAEYDRVRPLSYANADVAIACYSVVNPGSFQHVKSAWVPELRSVVSTAPIVVTALQIEMRGHGDTKAALATKGLHPVTTEEAEELKNSLKLAASVECSAVTGDSVENVFETAVKALWERDAKLNERQKEMKGKKGKKQRKEIVIQKDPEIERQILALAAQLEKKEIAFDEWNNRLQALLEAQALDLEQKEKAKRMFEKYDTDGSGSIDPEEFRELALKMSGEPWNDEELAKAIREIDKDGSGTIDFEEFYSWWSSPDSHTVKNPKLASMRVDLQAKALKKRTAKIARGFTSAVKGASDETSTKMNITLSAGDFEPKSSLNLSLLHDLSLANSLRARVAATETDLVLSIAFTLAKDADVFEVGELSGLVKEMISLGKEIVPYKTIRTECTTEADGTRLYRISLVFDSSLHELISETLEGLNIVKQLSVVVNLASGPGDKEKTAGASLGVTADVGLSEETLRQLVTSFAAPEDSDEDEDEDALGGPGPGRLAMLFACLRTFNLNLSLSDLEDTGLEALFAWDSHKSIILDLFSDIATQPFVGGIVEKLSLLDGLHSFVVCGKEHVLQLQARSLSIFKLAPTPKELQTIKENAEKALDDPFAAYLQEALGADFLANLGPGDAGSEEASEGDNEEVEEPLVNRLVLEYNKDLTSSIAAADPLDVLHKASHWKEELTSESPFGAVLELKSDQTVRVVAKVKNVEPGTYVPIARVKLHYFAKIGSPEWSTTYEGELGTETETFPWDEEDINQAKSNQWTELVITSKPITVKNRCTVTVQLVVPAANGWKTGLTLDWFGVKIAKPLPRVAELKELSICSREAIFQEEVFNTEFNCVVCAACAEKCSKPDTLERKKSAYAFFACKCNDVSPDGCKCHDTEPPAEKPNRLVRIFPVYQLDNTGLKAQFMSSVEAAALTPANHPCPPNEVTYFEMTVVKAGEEKLTAIGLVDKSLRRSPIWPGWRGHSFGYHGDDGHLFAGRLGGGVEAQGDKTVPYADGDVVGCGYDPTNQQVFFTHNGTLLSHCLSDVPARPYYPCIALRGLGTSVEVNFTGPFKFSTDTWSPKAADDAECAAVSCNKSSDE